MHTRARQAITEYTCRSLTRVCLYMCASLWDLHNALCLESSSQFNLHNALCLVPECITVGLAQCTLPIDVLASHWDFHNALCLESASQLDLHNALCQRVHHSGTCTMHFACGLQDACIPSYNVFMYYIDQTTIPGIRKFGVDDACHYESPAKY